MLTHCELFYIVQHREMLIHNTFPLLRISEVFLTLKLLLRYNKYMNGWLVGSVLGHINS